MGVELIDSPEVLRQCLGELGLTSRQLLPFSGWLLLTHGGEKPLDVSSASLAHYRKLLKRLGPIDPKVWEELWSEINDGFPRYGYRLDLDSGSVVRRRVA